MTYDLVIIGGGPAGVAAGVYAARKKIKTALVTAEFGGQSLISADVQNWIGTKSISGFELAKNLEEHLRAQEDIDIFFPDFVIKVSKLDNGFRVQLKSGPWLETRAVLLTTGSRRRRLQVPGENELDGKGVVYCSTCDAPIFKNKITAVVGGGNAGLEAVRDLLSYATRIYLLQRSDALKGDPITQEQIKKESKVTIIFNALTQKILGDKFVTGLVYQDAKTGEQKELKLDGVFVEIGSVSNADIVKDLVQLNNYGEITVDHKTQRTSQDGVWAAGDVCDVLYKQNNISAGDAVKAVLNIHDWLHKNKG